MMHSAESVCLVLNGKAAMRDDVRAAVHAIRQQGCDVDVRVTWESGDAADFARRAADSGVAVVVAGGGDGTLNEVTRGLLDGCHSIKQVPSLAVLPLGTANDLARACNVPIDPLLAMRLAAFGDAYEIDVGRANGRYFVNVAAGGFGAQVTTATPNELKRILGSAAYVVTGLTHFTSIRAARGRLSGPGLAWEGSFLLLAVGNGRQSGGGHQLCPEALLDDGLLDVVVLPELPPSEIASTLRALLREGAVAIGDALVRARVTWLEIETEEPLQINLDGEPLTADRFRFEIDARRLRMKLPPDCPLLTRFPAAATRKD